MLGPLQQVVFIDSLRLIGANLSHLALRRNVQSRALTQKIHVTVDKAIGVILDQCRHPLF